jgi:hypothetical protein
MLPSSLAIEIVPPLKRGVLFLEIPTTKNSVVIGPCLTDEHSLANISRDRVVRAFSDAYRDYPMDYGRPIAGDGLSAVVWIESRDSLLERIRRLEDWYPDDADALRSLLEEPGLLPNARTTPIAITADYGHAIVDISKARKAAPVSAHRR